MKKYLLVLSLLGIIAGCNQQSHISATNIGISTVIDTPIDTSKNTADETGNIAKLKQRFAQLQQGKKDIIRITQFGDSHSAADFFTGRLRNVLQQRYGDAGIGWISPLFIRGQRHEKITYDSEDWQLFDSRRDDEDNYPMGGYIAKSQSDTGFIQIKHKNNDSGQWALKLLVKNPTDMDWQVTSHTTKLPANIDSQGEGMEIGGAWLTRLPATGIIVETVAANGAKNTLWDKWESSWLQRDLAKLSRSDMVILAYGTNEAFNNRLDIRKFAHDMNKRVKQIRQALPHAVILVIGAPESYKKRPSKQQLALNNDLSSDDCDSQRPALLSQIQQIQSDIAEQYGILYWDWQQAIGGQCQVSQLINDDLMQKDGIHFTAKGYEYAADKLIEYLASIGLIQ